MCDVWLVRKGGKSVKKGFIWKCSSKHKVFVGRSCTKTKMYGTFMDVFSS